jgi:predicted 3-demethylubiquinone-9 3-methyltransferase (glyoxalase superfamily)
MEYFMQKIIPHLWYDKEAKEAAEFYCSLFPDSKITNVTQLHDTPSGDCDIVSYELWGMKFMAISAGPMFKFNPSISFMVNFNPQLFKGSSTEKDAREKLDIIWEKLTEGGEILMPLDKYPFSEHYGWVQDKYGLSWQLMLTNSEDEQRPPIMPFLFFARDKCGRAEEAINFYMSIFKDSKLGSLTRYGPNQAPDKEGTIMFADIMIENQWFAVMESAHEHNFDFNEAISFIVSGENQKEINYYWEKLSFVPEAEQCGWLKDKFGVSWQVSPVELGELLQKGTQNQIDRVTQALLPMKKLDIEKLKKVYESGK